MKLEDYRQFSNIWKMLTGYVFGYSGYDLILAIFTSRAKKKPQTVRSEANYLVFQTRLERVTYGLEVQMPRSQNYHESSILDTFIKTYPLSILALNITVVSHIYISQAICISGKPSQATASHRYRPQKMNFDFSQIDKHIRDIPSMKDKGFLHVSLKPLDEVDLEEHTPDLFDNECDGYCGI